MQSSNQNEILIKAFTKKGINNIFPKNSVVVRQGELMDKMYLILKGIVRGYYLDENGKEITKCFSQEGEVFGVEGFLYQREASYYIECLENVECISVSYNQVRAWMAEKKENDMIANGMIIGALETMEKRARDLLLVDAKTRYENFQKDYGNIASRIKQKMIASYLGIDEASLSRIKSKN